MINDILDQLRRDEGLRLAAYKDSLGFWTIGYGHKLNIPSDQNCSLLWTKDQAEINLVEDLRAKLLELRKVLPWVDDLDVVRRGVLQNMSFNVGVHGVLKFKNMLAAMEKGDYTLASDHGRCSLWFRQVKARAERLMDQLEDGQWR